jgi:hypothetical protein
MESSQSPSANGTPMTGKPMTEGSGTEKLNRSVVGVIDELLITLNDHVLNAESAVRENTAQLRVMASSVELAREIPKKMAVVEKQLTAMAGHLEMCLGSVAKLNERVDTFERSTVNKLSERMDGLDKSMQQVAVKPAVWGAEMSDLRVELRRHAELFERPQIKTVHHRHYLNWYIWIVIGMFGACAVLVTLWRGAQKDASLKTNNDMLWRGARQFLDSTLQQRLDSVERHYDANPEQFLQDVKAQEAHSVELTQRLQEANQKQQEADQVQQEASQAKREVDELKKQKKRR